MAVESTHSQKWKIKDHNHIAICLIHDAWPESEHTHAKIKLNIEHGTWNMEHTMHISKTVKWNERENIKGNKLHRRWYSMARKQRSKQGIRCQTFGGQHLAFFDIRIPFHLSSLWFNFIGCYQVQVFRHENLRIFFFTFSSLTANGANQIPKYLKCVHLFMSSPAKQSYWKRREKKNVEFCTI